MTVFIRADASIEIGTGHIMRCLTWASDLISQGRVVFFICRDLPGNMVDYIQRKGYQTLLLTMPEIAEVDNYVQWLSENWVIDAEETKQHILQNKKAEDQVLLVVDHYSLDKKWECFLRQDVNQIMVIDDLANRSHDCDTLLDQNYYRDMNRRYEGLVPLECKLLLGPKYALLRPEFYEAKKSLRQRDGIVRRILIFFGGSDPTGETEKALAAIRILRRPDIAVDVVVGLSNPERENIRKICSGLPQVIFHCQVENMAELIAGADLAIGAGGVTALERCFLELPSIVVAVAENQVETVRCLSEIEVAEYLGWGKRVSPEMLAGAMKSFLNDSCRIAEMSRRCLALFED